MKFSRLFFDFDSTLVHEETLDLLAMRKGVGEAVRRLTAASMEGSVPIAEVFRQKMDILSPSRAELAAFTACSTRIFTRDVPPLIEALRWLRKEIYILSSGFHEIIDPVALMLGVPPERVLANRIDFDARGSFRGVIDAEVPIAADGKAQALRRIPIAKSEGVMVGDAVTDMATRDDVALFVGFGGVARRKRVEEEAAAYISSKSLAPLLLVVTTPEEFEALLREKNFQHLARRAKRLRKYVKKQ